MMRSHKIMLLIYLSVFTSGPYAREVWGGGTKTPPIAKNIPKRSTLSALHKQNPRQLYHAIIVGPISLQFTALVCLIVY